MAFDRAVFQNEVAFFGGKLSTACSGGQFLVAGSNTLSAIGSTTKTFNYTEIDLAPGGSNNTKPVGYALLNAGSGEVVSYLRNAVVTCPAGAAVEAGAAVQVQGESTFRAVVTSVAASGTVGIALNTAASGAGVLVALNL